MIETIAIKESGDDFDDGLDGFREEMKDLHACWHGGQKSEDKLSLGGKYEEESLLQERMLRLPGCNTRRTYQETGGVVVVATSPDLPDPVLQDAISIVKNIISFLSQEQRDQLVDIAIESVMALDVSSNEIDVWQASQVIKKQQIFQRAAEWSREKAEETKAKEQVQLTEECSMSETVFLSSKV
eukprot:763047-Hanusia_phi.AAC.4